MTYFYTLGKCNRFELISTVRVSEDQLEITCDFEIPPNQISYYGVIDGEVVFIDISEEEKMTVNKQAELDDIISEIAYLKKELENTDFKVIKNYELSMANLPLKYDPITLHSERQAMRDRLNELEKK